MELLIAVILVIVSLSLILGSYYHQHNKIINENMENTFENLTYSPSTSPSPSVSYSPSASLENNIDELITASGVVFYADLLANKSIRKRSPNVCPWCGSNHGRITDSHGNCINCGGDLGVD